MAARGVGGGGGGGGVELALAASASASRATVVDLRTTWRALCAISWAGDGDISGTSPGSVVAPTTTSKVVSTAANVSKVIVPVLTACAIGITVDSSTVPAAAAPAGAAITAVVATAANCPRE